MAYSYIGEALSRVFDDTNKNLHAITKAKKELGTLLKQEPADYDLICEKLKYIDFLLEKKAWLVQEQLFLYELDEIERRVTYKQEAEEI